MKAEPKLKRTPGPWKVVNGNIIVRLEYDGNDAAICDVRTGEADAAFIVRAANAHDELVAAARKALSALVAYQPPSGKQSFVIREAIDDLQAALSKHD